LWRSVRALAVENIKKRPALKRRPLRKGEFHVSPAETPRCAHRQAPRTPEVVSEPSYRPNDPTRSIRYRRRRSNRRGEPGDGPFRRRTVINLYLKPDDRSRWHSTMTGAVLWRAVAGGIRAVARMSLRQPRQHGGNAVSGARAQAVDAPGRVAATRRSRRRCRRCRRAGPGDSSRGRRRRHRPPKRGRIHRTHRPHARRRHRPERIATRDAIRRRDPKRVQRRRR
jgi:hypothetical protein